MPYKVLVVDDSNFFQRRLKEIINEHPELKVVGVAVNGREAVEMEDQLRPDIISMDYEMPVMDGISAIKAILAKRKVPILMFSSMTYEGARITLDALAAGAVDFITKDFGEVSSNSQQIKRKLHQRLLDIIKCHQRPVAVKPSPVSPYVSNTTVARDLSDDKNLRRRINIIGIGASTGGPVALAEVIKALPGDFPVPIMLVQHMPENFTKAFAERLDRQSQLSVKEAVDGDKLKPGHVLLAPGGKQMIVDPKDKTRIKIINGDDRINYKPSVDITFASMASTYGNACIGVVMTGMGSDGCEGARLLKNSESVVWSQDEASCVIYGMPMAVANAKLSDKVLALNDFAPSLKAAFC